MRAVLRLDKLHLELRGVNSKTHFENTSTLDFEYSPNVVIIINQKQHLLQILAICLSSNIVSTELVISFSAPNESN